MSLEGLRLPIFLLLSTAAFAQPVEVHGYIQGRFTDQEGTPDRLEIRRARLLVSGTPESQFSYHVQIDFAKSPYLVDLSVAWRFSRLLTVSAGQMKIPFSAENIISDNVNAPISRSRAVLKLVPGRDTGVQGRDVGAAFSGSFDLLKGQSLDYAVGVFRGQTFIYAPQVHYRASSARIVFHPVSGMSVGGDWYGSFDTPARLEKRREDLEGEYTRGRLDFRAEQIWARDGALNRRGGYVLGAWKVSPGWEGLLRTDWFTANASKPGTFSVAYAGGANRTLWKHVKIGVNAGAQHDQKPAQWSSVFFAQVMPYF